MEKTGKVIEREKRKALVKELRRVIKLVQNSGEVDVKLFEEEIGIETVYYGSHVVKKPSMPGKTTLRLHLEFYFPSTISQKKVDKIKPT